MSYHSFEDNQGVYLLETNQHVSTRIEYFCVKHHFFWSYVYHPKNNLDGWLLIIKYPTELINAEYLMKRLSTKASQANWKRIHGWWQASLHSVHKSLLNIFTILLHIFTYIHIYIYIYIYVVCNNTFQMFHHQNPRGKVERGPCLNTTLQIWSIH